MVRALRLTPPCPSCARSSPHLLQAFGMSIMVLAYAIGHVSGCHLNTAVTFSLMLSGTCGFVQARRPPRWGWGGGGGGPAYPAPAVHAPRPALSAPCMLPTGPLQHGGSVPGLHFCCRHPGERVSLQGSKARSRGQRLRPHTPATTPPPCCPPTPLRPPNRSTEPPPMPPILRWELMQYQHRSRTARRTLGRW